MGNQAAVIKLSDNDRATLEGWVRSGTTEQRLVFRAQIVLTAAAGTQNIRIAESLHTSQVTVGKWRRRFAKEGLSGLDDAPRTGKPVTYSAETERRILAKLDESPPEGYTTWTGDLLAKALGNVSDDQVWRVLRKHNIHLTRRRSWCISTDPEFAAKAADIVGLYLNPPDNAIVLCVDEKPNIQALERAQGWLKLPNGKALTGFSHEYKRHGTTNLFSALEVTTGLIKAGHYPRKRRVEFLDFMTQVVAGYPEATELHVILDNYSTHKVERERWAKRHTNVHFHYTPTHASWLNQVEIWFSILWRRVLRGASFTSPRQICEAIDRFVATYNLESAPFEWRKETVYQSSPKRHYRNLCK